MSNKEKIQDKILELHFLLKEIHKLNYGDREPASLTTERVNRATRKALEELDKDEYETVDFYCSKKCRGYKVGLCKNCLLNDFRKEVNYSE